MNKQSSYTIQLSHRAQQDFKNIQRYTLDKHGKTQVLKYSTLIKACFETLATNPLLGHWRPDIPQTYKAYHAGQHIIVYRVQEHIIYVVAILHSSMDFIHQLGI